MTQSQTVCIADYARTVTGKFNGTPSAVRPDGLAAIVLRALAAHDPAASEPARTGGGQGLAAVLEA